MFLKVYSEENALIKKMLLKAYSDKEMVVKVYSDKENASESIL